MIYRTPVREGEAPSEPQIREATSNLLYMPAYAGQLPVKEHELAPLLREGRDWFEILTRLFATHLMEEWQRGVLRNYEAREDELPTLRGKWRISDQLRRPERKHIFSVAYDEFAAQAQRKVVSIGGVNRERSGCNEETDG